MQGCLDSGLYASRLGGPTTGMSYLSSPVATSTSVSSFLQIHFLECLPAVLSCMVPVWSCTLLPPCCNCTSVSGLVTHSTKCVSDFSSGSGSKFSISLWTIQREIIKWRSWQMLSHPERAVERSDPFAPKQSDSDYTLTAAVWELLLHPLPVCLSVGAHYGDCSAVQCVNLNALRWDLFFSRAGPNKNTKRSLSRANILKNRISIFFTLLYSSKSLV